VAGGCAAEAAGTAASRKAVRRGMRRPAGAAALAVMGPAPHGARRPPTRNVGPCPDAACPSLFAVAFMTLDKVFFLTTKRLLGYW